jgi:hypothetical protein
MNFLNIFDHCHAYIRRFTKCTLDVELENGGRTSVLPTSNHVQATYYIEARVNISQAGLVIV